MLDVPRTDSGQFMHHWPAGGNHQCVPVRLDKRTGKVNRPPLHAAGDQCWKNLKNDRLLVFRRSPEHIKIAARLAQVRYVRSHRKAISHRHSKHVVFISAKFITMTEQTQPPPDITARTALYLEKPDGARLAYHKRDGCGPTLVFLGGFMSDMTGTKALALEALARERGWAFLRLDYQDMASLRENLRMALSASGFPTRSI